MEMMLSAGAAQVLERLTACGHRAWAVGGCVRDSLLGLPPQDFDLTTTALPQEVMTCFEGYRTIPTGMKHGTVTVVVDGEPVEVTTLRADGSYKDGRRPQTVTFVQSLKADLTRRDFTVNAMAWSPADGLIDPFDGQGDLAQRLLRCVGEPAARLEEDGLRILRCLRFAACLGFSIEANTAAALHSGGEGLRRVAAERTTAELLRLLCGAAAGAVIAEYRDILQVIVESIIPNVEKTIFQSAPADPAFRLALLLAGESTAVERTLQGLRLDGDTRRRVRRFYVQAGAPLPTHREAAAELVRRMGREPATLLAGFWEATAHTESGVKRAELECAAGHTRQVLEGCCEVKELALNGSDLLEGNIPEGRAVGELLHQLLVRVMAGELPNRRKNLREAGLHLYRNGRMW